MEIIFSFSLETANHHIKHSQASYHSIQSQVQGIYTNLYQSYEIYMITSSALMKKKKITIKAVSNFSGQNIYYKFQFCHTCTSYYYHIFPGYKSEPSHTVQVHYNILIEITCSNHDDTTTFTIKISASVAQNMNHIYLKDNLNLVIYVQVLSKCLINASYYNGVTLNPVNKGWLTRYS